jgi:hypothetical protein
VLNILPYGQSQQSTTGATSSVVGGFQYSIDNDVSFPVQFPPVTTPTAPTLPAPPLAAYPYFVFFGPGKPLVTVSLVGIAMATVDMLKSNCEFEAATQWYRSVFDPTQRDNTWARCQSRRSDPGSEESRTKKNVSVKPAESRSTETPTSRPGDVKNPTKDTKGSTDTKAASLEAKAKPESNDAKTSPQMRSMRSPHPQVQARLRPRL